MIVVIVNNSFSLHILSLLFSLFISLHCQGIGWYSRGTFFYRGRAVAKQIAFYDIGDTVGLFISVCSEKEKRNYIRWFKNRQEVNGKLSIETTLPKEPLYLVCFLANHQEVRLRYRGHAIPKGYHETHAKWRKGKGALLW